MDPKLKKIIEISIVLVVFYYVFYLIVYIFFLDSYCNQFSQEVNNIKKINLKITSECKNSYFCKLGDKKYTRGKLYSYDCVKQKINRYELEYYRNIFLNLFNKIDE